MRVLIGWGSKRGGTEGIARIIGEELRRSGIDAVVEPASGRSVQGFDAVIIGGALYANHWHAAAHRLVTRNIAALRRVPVWLFSSGLLDASADKGDIPPISAADWLLMRKAFRPRRWRRRRAATGATRIAYARGPPILPVPSRLPGLGRRWTRPHGRSGGFWLMASPAGWPEAS